MVALFLDLRVSLIVLVLILSGRAEGQNKQGGQIKGIVVDVTGGALQGLLRVLLPPANTLITRMTADYNGTFQSSTLRPGSYTLIAWMQGFRARRLAVVVR